MPDLPALFAALYALQRVVATIVGECKWTSRRVAAQLLSDLETYKLPAMRQGGVRFPQDGPLILLFGKTGFKDSLVEIAAERTDVRLVELEDVVADLMT